MSQLCWHGGADHAAILGPESGTLKAFAPLSRSIWTTASVSVAGLITTRFSFVRHQLRSPMANGSMSVLRTPALGPYADQRAPRIPFPIRANSFATEHIFAMLRYDAETRLNHEPLQTKNNSARIVARVLDQSANFRHSKSRVLFATRLSGRFLHAHSCFSSNIVLPFQKPGEHSALRRSL